jgi:hypothetical protein
MNILTRKRRSYIEDATGKMKLLDHIADVLFTQRMINNEELEHIQSIPGTQDKARTLIDTARMKGDITSNTFMTTWDNYPASSSDRDDNGMSPKEIRQILNKLTRDDIESMTFLMNEIDITHQQTSSAVDLDYVTDRTLLAEGIALRYGAEARAVLNILLRKIHRNDLVNPVKGSDYTHLSSQVQPEIFAAYGKVINTHKGAVMEKVLNILSDLDRGNLKGFVWTLNLPKSKAELIRNATDLAKVLKEHVHHDMVSYLDTIYKTLREAKQNNLAYQLNNYIVGLGR